MCVNYGLFSKRTLVASVVCCLAAGSGAFGQIASQITQPTYAPQESEVTGGFELPLTADASVPEGAEQLYVAPSDAIIEGGFQDMAEAHERLRKKLSGQSVSAAELFEAAAELEQAYIQAGYLLARVSLPPQTVRDGMPVFFVVIDGFVEDVDASSLSSRVQDRVAKTLKPLIGVRGLKSGELERRLLLAGDTAGLALRSTLKPGLSPGGTVIVVDGEYRPVGGSAGINNGMSDDLGVTTGDINATFNSLLGLGETVYGSANGYPLPGEEGVMSPTPRNRQLAAGFILPLGYDGLWFNGEYASSQTNPDNGYGFTIRDEFQRLSARLGYELVRSRDLNLTTLAILDITSEVQSFLAPGIDEQLSHDELRVLRLSQKGAFAPEPGSQISGDLTFSLGLNAFGAREPTSSLPLSRFGAEPGFQKLSGSIAYIHALLGGRAQFKLSARAQTSFGNVLPSSEQFAIGGLGRVSAFDQGSISGDSGAVGRVELTAPLPMPQKMGIDSTIWPYVFGAAGAVELTYPTALENATETAVAAGLGVRIALSQPETSNQSYVEMEFASGGRSSTGHQSRLNFSINSVF